LRALWPLTCLLAGLWSCVPLGMNLPSDDEQPLPEGSRIKPAVGWLATRPGEAANGAPDGEMKISVVHVGGRTMIQQVRRYSVGEAKYGDSVLLERSSLRPVETWRWTPRGTYVARYNHRVVERVFQPVRGSAVRTSETLDLEPYSALGMELLIASLPLSQGYHGLLPVAVDTAARGGWSWLRFEVQAEIERQERPDQKAFSVWIVDCNNGANSSGLERTRLYIAIDGRSVREMQRLGPDNEKLGTVRRMLLGVPAPRKAGE
jgi:hypothetical protein